MTPATAATGTKLFIIGGAEDRTGKATLLRRFVRLAGGREARIVVVPTASSFRDEVIASYRDVFTRLGAPAPKVVDPTTRAQAGSSKYVESLDNATGVFFSGGSQLKLGNVFPGTAAGRAVHRAHQRGAVIAGTSAGASIMSDFMIAMGQEGVIPKQRTSQISQGLGLMTGVVVDQHFGQRTRYGRLLSVTAASPDLLGIGIDEDTAIEVTDGHLLTVHGRGGVFVLNCRDAVTDAADARRGAPLLVSGAVVHTLPAGATFDLKTATLVDFVEKHPDVDVKVAKTRI